MAPTKTNTQNSTKHVEQHVVTDVQNKLYLWFLYNILYIKLLLCNDRVNDYKSIILSVIVFDISMHYIIISFN